MLKLFPYRGASNGPREMILCCVLWFKLKCKVHVTNRQGGAGLTDEAFTRGASPVSVVQPIKACGDYNHFDVFITLRKNALVQGMTLLRTIRHTPEGLAEYLRRELDVFPDLFKVH